MYGGKVTNPIAQDSIVMHLINLFVINFQSVPGIRIRLSAIILIVVINNLLKENVTIYKNVNESLLYFFLF